MRSTKLKWRPNIACAELCFRVEDCCSRRLMPVPRMPESVTARMKDVSIQTCDTAFHMFRQQLLDASRDETPSGSCELGSSLRESTVEAR